MTTAMRTPTPVSAPRRAARDRRGTLPVAVRGLGAALPSTIVTNDDLAARMDTNDEWIRSRTGIAQRHVAAPGQATSDLAAEAGAAAIADAGLVPGDIGTILVATTTPDHAIPGCAPLVAAKLGTQAAALDLNAACSGFVYGLRVAGGLARTGDGPILLVGAEIFTRVVGPDDRDVAILFGDGAGAVVLEADDDGRLGPFDLGSDGTDPSMLWCEAGGTAMPATPELVDDGRHHLTMRGREVYRNAVATMSASSRRVLDAAGLDVDDVDLLVGHQANRRILAAVGDRLGIDESRCHVSVDRHANTSAASIPLALADARAAGVLTEGDLVLLTAFGAGLTWASTLLTWEPSR